MQVTPTGKKNHYDGPESIMEYYSLQNEYFNPPSYRLAVSAYNISKHYYPKWDAAMPDGGASRMHPSYKLGVSFFLAMHDSTKHCFPLGRHAVLLWDERESYV